MVLQDREHLSIGQPAVNKHLILTAPILAYPDFTRDFVLETDANKQGLGVILSQSQDDSKLHPFAYASCSLSPSE